MSKQFNPDTPEISVEAQDSSASPDLSPAEAALKQELAGFEALERFAPVALLQALQQMRAFQTAGETYARQGLAQQLNFIPKYDRLYAALLAILEQAGYIDLTAQAIKTTPKVAQAETLQALQTLSEQWENLQQTYPMLHPHFNLLLTCLQALPEIVQGQVLATDIIFPNGSMDLVTDVYKGGSLTDYFSRLAALGVKNYVAQRLPTLNSSEKIKIVEVGAGTGGTSGFALAALAPYADSLDYFYTDISQGFTQYGQSRFGPQYPFARFRLLDIEKSPADQGFELNQAEIVLGTNVVHTTKDIRHTLQNLKVLLKAGGLLILNESTQFSVFTALTFGLLEGWGAFEDEEIRIDHSPLLSQEKWRQTLAEEGFNHLNFFRLPQSYAAYHNVQCVMIAQSDGIIVTPLGKESTPAGFTPDKSSLKPVRFSPSPAASSQPGLDHNGSTLKEPVQPSSPAVQSTPLAENKPETNNETRPSGELVAEIEQTILDQVSELLKLPPERIEPDRSFARYGVDSIVGIDLVNRISQAIGIQLRTTALFDYPDIQTLARHIVKTYGEKIRQDRRHTASSNTSSTISAEPASTPVKGLFDPFPAHASNGPAIEHDGYRPDLQGIQNPSGRATGEVQAVVIRQPGTPDTLQTEPITLPPPEADQIQIAVRAFSLNFADLLCLKGMYPNMPAYPFVPGFEVAGIVRQVGRLVSDLAPGDEVVALTTGALGGHATLVNARAELTIKKPTNLDFEAACAFPIVFLTAYTAFEKAEVTAGEKILIQTAAGGVGLMAVQLARRANVEIFGTAGSAEKCAYLKQIGVDHVINYRAEDFYEVIQRITDGYGVDVVLNTLSGDYIQKGLDSLAPDGRYIEIAMTGLKSATAVDLSNLVNNQSLHTIDLGRMTLKHPHKARTYLEQMRQIMAAGEITPNVDRVFPFTGLAQAYQYLDDRKNIGKVVVSTADVAVSPTPSSALRAAPVSVLDPVQEPRQGGWQDIAIIGMSGRFPGAKTPAEFWENLAQGRSAITEVPPERWPLADYYDPNPDHPHKTYSKWGGFLDDIDRFDAQFFKLSGREAEWMDPQQRLFLEACWTALEDAGYARSELDERRYGTFLGGGNSDYLLKMMRSGVAVQGHAFMGNDPSVCAARIAYLLNLKGPSLVVNTACSSSLVAIHLACQSLCQGDSEVALAGGVFIGTTPDFHILSSKVGMLSPDGKCKAFDDAADGFVPGEGVGVIVLKPLARAVADKDHIYGVIRGSGINQDGKTNGITAPSTLSQTELEKAVYTKSGINPETIGYVECHGTGTKLGDPIEIEALTNAFRAYTDKKQFCALGSVKTNIGHAAMAAGIASVIKVLLALKHKQLPPSLHFHTPNAHIDFENSPFYVNTGLKDWPAENGPRRAAVSSFGFSGTNVHLVIEESPVIKDEGGRMKAEGMNLHPSSFIPHPYLVLLSAKNEARLREYAQKLLNFVEIESDVSLAELAYTLQVGREAMESRLAFLAADKDTVISKLNAFVAGEVKIVDGYQGQIKRKSETLTVLTVDEDIEEAINKWIVKGKLGKLAELWVKGLDVDWRLLYRDDKPGRISLPTYPFAEERYWMPEPEPESNDNYINGREAVPALTEPQPVISAQDKKSIIYMTPGWQARSLVDNGVGCASQPLMMVAGVEQETLDTIAATFRQAEVVALEPALGADIAGNVSVWVQLIWRQLKPRLEDKAGAAQQLLILVPETDQSFVYAPLVGLLKTARLEHPKIKSKMIWVSGLDTKEQDSLAAILREELNLNTFADLEVRYDHTGRREVKRLAELELRPDDKEVWLRPGGVYWITGGLGGLGRIFARHLVETGEAIKLILSGRSELDDTGRRQLAELGRQGGTIEYLRADVSQVAEVAQVVDRIKAEYGALHGIIHCAGVIRDSFILKKNLAEIETVLAPKVAGTVNIDAVTRAEPLDFMVLFSSVVGVRGNPGQADYAAANAFLDSFAHYRQQLVRAGKRYGRTISIDWPFWQTGGMQIDAPTLKLLERQGITPLETGTGLQAFEAIMACDKSQVVVAAGEPDKLRARLETDELVEHRALTGTLRGNLSGPDTQDSLTPAKGGVDLGLLRQKVRSELRRMVAEILKIKLQNIAADEELNEYGFDSLTLTEFANRLSESYQLELTPTLFFEYNTLRSLSTHLVERYEDILSRYYRISAVSALEPTKPAKAAAPDPPLRPPKPQVQPIRTASRTIENEPVAIIGMSGILPQSPDLETFWQHLAAGESLISEIPPDRWDWRDYDGDPHTESHKTNVRWGGFIPDVDKFDPLFFKISPKEAEVMDPQHRLFLQCVWHCLEDAGYRASDLSGRPVGVYVGVQFQEYQELITRLNGEVNALIGTGNAHAILANRVSYLLNLHGPSEAIDTACSSSLVAIHRAVKSIRSGEVECALAGGVSLALTPSTYVIAAQMGVLSPDGQCKTFDKGANGYAKGEGIGAVLLKPLSQAQADGDHIYGVIRGSAENHGGRATSLTAPNPKAQADLLVKAYQDAGIDPGTVSYIETHGTGTALGDPIEIDGLKRAFVRLSEGHELNQHHYCGLGSVKTNIGHLEPAAGIAGLFKVLLAMKHQTLPATINFTEQNPYIDLKDSPFYLVTETQTWEPLTDKAGQSIPRRAGVSSFGFGGANAHVVVEEAPWAKDEGERRKDETSYLHPSSFRLHPCLVVLSAKNEARLREYAQKLLGFVEEMLVRPSTASDMGYGEINLHLQTELVEIVAELVGVEPAELEVEQNFEEYGLDQVQLSRLSEQVAERYRCELPVTIFSGQSTVTTVAGYLEQHQGAFSGKHDSVQALTPSLTRLPSPDSGEATEGRGVRAIRRSALPNTTSDSPGPAAQDQTNVSLADLAYTLQIGREAMKARLALVVEDAADLRDKLGRYLANENDLDGVYQGYVPARTDRLELLTEDDEARDFIGALIKNGKLAKLAQLWVSGVDIEWALLYPNHRPRRISLPTYPFEKKRYWIPVPSRVRPNLAPAVDAQQPTEPVPRPLSKQMLFIEETWLEKALPVQQVNWVEQLARQGDQQILVIYEDEQDYEAMQDLLANIASILQDSSQARPPNYRFVKIGTSDRPGDEIDVLAKTDQSGIAQWVQGLKRDDQLPEVIFFLVPNPGDSSGKIGGVNALTPSLTRLPSPDSGEATEGRGVRAARDSKDDLRFFFYLVQAFMKEAAEKPIQGYYLFAGDDARPRLELEALSGLTGSVGLENPNHRYQTIRVEPATSAGQKAIILFNEWLLGSDDEPPLPVQYRSLDRSARILQEIEPASAGPEPVFRRGGVYLISGGLGEVGQALCEYLARTYHSTLVILTRSELDEIKQRQIERIEQAGGQVSYYPVDITDRQALQEKMVRVKERVGQIDGVFHLARRVEDGLIVDKEFEVFEQVMAAKVEGTIYLDEITRDEPLEFFVIFSSLAAYGIKGSPDYAYGSAFQNGFARWRETLVQAGKRSGRTRSICWGQWAMDPYSDETRNQLLAQMGFDFLTPDSGMPALEQCLAQERTVLGAMAVSDERKIKTLLGISAGEARGDGSDVLFDQIVLDLRHGRRRKEEVLETMAKFGLDHFSDQQIDVLHSLLVDRQPNGQPTQVSHTPAGKKMEAGDMTLRPRPATLPAEISIEIKNDVSPPNDTRVLILRTLQKILKLDEDDINPQESFQTYGLDSITGMQLAMALEKASGLEILPKWLIEYPNVEALAKKLEELKQ